MSSLQTCHLPSLAYPQPPPPHLTVPTDSSKSIPPTNGVEEAPVLTLLSTYPFPGPPALHTTVTHYINFYSTHLSPFLMQTKTDYLQHRNSNSPATTLSQEGTLDAIASIKRWYMYIPTRHLGPFGMLRLRWKAGLLREGCIRIIIITFSSLVQKLSRILSSVSIPSSSLESRIQAVKEVWGYMGQYHRLFEAFLAEKRFRSERLEALLERYLSEDGGEVGERVGREVGEITRGVGRFLESGRKFRLDGVGVGGFLPSGELRTYRGRGTYL